MVKPREDLTGWKMWEHGVPNSRLTVIEQTDDYIKNTGEHRAQWKCECNCENHTIILAEGSMLKSGHIKSCGCLKKDILLERNKECHKINTYSSKLIDQYGDYYIGITFNTNNNFYIDADDYKKVKDYCWSEHVSKNYHSLIAYNLESKEIVKMSHILGFKEYDHKDRNPLNNRKYNLRPATAGENARNVSVRPDNTSNIIGVSWMKQCNQWRAYLQFNKKNMNLGYFTDKTDAIKARLRAEDKYFGEFAPQKHLFEQYGINATK